MTGRRRSRGRWPAVRPSAAAVALLLAALAPAAPAAAQAPDELGALKREVEALKQEQARLRTEIRALREELRRSRAAAPAPAAPEGLTFALGNDPAKGDRAAPLVLVEFTDYQ